MKKIFTLATLGLLSAASFEAQAQVTLDGQLTAAELTAGNYVLLGKSNNFTGNQNTGRPFGNNGLLSLYVASTPTKVYMFLGGTVENTGNSFQLYIDRPGTSGVPAGTFLPAGEAGTSFEKVTRIKLEQAVELALALRGDGAPVGAAPQPYKAEAAIYTSATGVQSKSLTTAPVSILGNGTAFTIPATATTGSYAGLAGARMAYRNTTTGQIDTNPGNTTPITGATYGAAGSFGWEIELDRTALGVTTGTPAFRIFALYNNGNGGYASGEFIPQSTGALPASLPSPNLGGADNGPANDVDFATIPGSQTIGFSLGANGALGTKAADESSVAMSVFPNPAAGSATVAYRVVGGAENVQIALTDLTGRTVRVLAAGVKGAGTQSVKVSTADVAAGTYMVRVQVGEKVAVRRVVLL
ncbi:hypothetical protein GCM10022408_03550 [Hymenobacter fastidiosus]|uniref:Secretion system C-terminal sorting domain-containing protein n=1 Tax=Hymenobacter fastidiosus TaxID=486264 RepID=A0ABP7REB9_9BACT